MKLPELRRAPPAARASCRVQICTQAPFTGQTANWQHVWRDAAGVELVRAARRAQRLFLQFPNICEAALDSSGQIGLWRHPAADEATLRHVLLDQILPRALAQQGHLMLHGGLVSLGHNQGVLLVGDTGRGKSTLCAAMAAAGFELASDDCVRLDTTGGTLRALPTYPGLRLLPDSLAALFPEAQPETSPVAHYTLKRRVALESPTAMPALQPVAIFVLQPPTAAKQIESARLSPAQACMALVANSFQLDPGDMLRVHALLAQAARVAEHVPVHTLAYPRSFAQLPELLAYMRALVE